jgi:hypothetical protein
MKSYSQFLKYKINEAISFKTTANVSASGKIYKHKIITDKVEGSMGETFDMEGYMEALHRVDTRMLYIDTTGYTISHGFFTGIELKNCLRYNKEEVIEWFIEEYGEGKYWKSGMDLGLLDTEKKSNIIDDCETIGDLLEYLDEDEYLPFALDFDIEYKDFVGGSYSHPSEIKENEIIANDGELTGDYSHVYVGKIGHNGFDFDFPYEKLEIPVIKTKEEFSWFYQDVFNTDSEKILNYVRDPDEERDDEDEDEPTENDYAVYWDMIEDQYCVPKTK